MGGMYALHFSNESECANPKREKDFKINFLFKPEEEGMDEPPSHTHLGDLDCVCVCVCLCMYVHGCTHSTYERLVSLNT